MGGNSTLSRWVGDALKLDMFEGVPSGLVPGLDCQTALFLTFSIRLNRKMIEKPCRDGTLKMFTGSRTIWTASSSATTLKCVEMLKGACVLVYVWFVQGRVWHRRQGFCYAMVWHSLSTTHADFFRKIHFGDQETMALKNGISSKSVWAINCETTLVIK